MNRTSTALNTIVKIGWIPVLLAACYSGWVLYSRHAQNRRGEEAEAVEAARRAQGDREILRRLGGGQLKILTFYASPAIVEGGERTLLCYGVAGAKSVRIEPAVELVSPALSRCIEIRPRQETRYVLTAEDGQGKTVKQETVVGVK